MASMLEQPLKFFVVFFVVVEPVSLIPLFTGLTSGAASGYKRRMALKSVLVAAAILLLFALGGAPFLALWESACPRSASSAASCCSCCLWRWCSRASRARAPPAARRPRAGG